MQTLLVAACPFCALARIVADIFCHSEQRLRSHGPHVHMQRLCALLACVAGALYGQCITLTEMDPRHPALGSEAGKMYAIACTQCHALPDPRRHTPREWPGVVERMKEHMAWANTVVGPDSLKTSPVLDTAEIVRFLQRYARAEQKAN